MLGRADGRRLGLGCPKPNGLPDRGRPFALAVRRPSVTAAAASKEIAGVTQLNSHTQLLQFVTPPQC